MKNVAWQKLEQPDTDAVSHPAIWVMIFTRALVNREFKKEEAFKITYKIIEITFKMTF